MEIQKKRVDNGKTTINSKKKSLSEWRKTKNKNTDLGESCPFSLLAVKI